MRFFFFFFFAPRAFHKQKEQQINGLSESPWHEAQGEINQQVIGNLLRAEEYERANLGGRLFFPLFCLKFTGRNAIFERPPPPPPSRSIFFRYLL